MILQNHLFGMVGWCCLALLQPACAQSKPEPPSVPFLEAEFLKKLPHVHSATGSPAKIKRRRQIIHLLNWHFVEREPFIADLSDVAGRRLSDAEADEHWTSFLQEVEAVQAQQRVLFRELVRSHGLKQVFLEGLASGDGEEFEALCLKVAKHRPRKDDSALGELLAQIHRENKLLIGVAGQLLGSGEIEKVLPAEDAKLMEAANPVKDGRVKFDTTAIERREDAIVRNVLAAKSRVSVVVLGGSHDLAEDIERIGGGEVEYVRVEVEAHRSEMGE